MHLESPRRWHRFRAVLAASTVAVAATLGIADGQDVSAAANAFTTMNSVAMINLSVLADDQRAADQAARRVKKGDYYGWKGKLQTYPTGMDGDPEGFAQMLRTALPIVNTLRLPFNEHSFDTQGRLHEQYERFLTESAKQGFQIVFVYAGADTQSMGKNVDDAIAVDKLNTNHTVVRAAWATMLNWLDRNPVVEANVFGLELMNEPASYRDLGKKVAPFDGNFYIKLYADHSIALAKQIAPRADARILVDGWGFAGNFDPLADATIGKQNALNYIKAGVGKRLVWSWHFYPGWSDSNLGHDATSVDEQLAALKAEIDLLRGTPIIMTETNIVGDADDITKGQNYTNFMSAAFEYLAEQRVGIGWFPGAESGASNLVVIDNGSKLRYLHQHSFAHAMNAFSAYDSPRGSARRGQTINATVLPAKLQRERYDRESRFDPVSGLGNAFGYGGNDTINGSDEANNFLYGGTGNDTLNGASHDDFLFGQHGNDVLNAGAGRDHLFGGSGDDVLNGGDGYDQMRGDTGKDRFVTDGTGDDVIIDLVPGTDQLEIPGMTSWSAVKLAVSQIDADKDGRDDVKIVTPNGSVVLLDVDATQLSAANFVGLTS